MDTIKSFTKGTDKLSFDGMTGITAVTGTAISTTAVAAADGAVYVSTNGSINGDTIDYSKVLALTSVNDAVVQVTDASVMADVAAYLTNALTKETAGESYVVVINASATQSYVYDVNVTTNDVITADDIALIGSVTTDIAFTAGDIA